jgi:hypothetical protein
LRIYGKAKNTRPKISSERESCREVKREFQYPKCIYIYIYIYIRK